MKNKKNGPNYEVTFILLTVCAVLGFAVGYVAVYLDLDALKKGFIGFLPIMANVLPVVAFAAGVGLFVPSVIFLKKEKGSWGKT